METQIRILGIAGSLRRGSYNRAALRAATELAPKSVTIETFELGGIPPLCNLVSNGNRTRYGILSSVTGLQSFKT